MAGSVNDTVVIAVDGSENAEDAFNWYAEHMHKTGNTLILVHCMEMPSVPSRDTWEVQTKAGRQKGQEVEDKYVKMMEKFGIPGKFNMEFEKPGEHVVQVAKKENGTVIVMGTRGLGKIRRTILGSVSNYVLNHAPCPVLVVRPKKDE